jgi:Protein of unknown function (DUF998)
MSSAVIAERRTTNRVSDRALAWSTLAGVVVYVAIDVLLKFLRPGYSLLHNAESDYGRGPWYWVMDLDFLLRCALSLGIAAAIARIVRSGSPGAAASSDPAAAGRGSGTGRAGVILLVIWAVCSGLLAFFADDIEGQPVHGSGAVHLLLAFIAFPCVAVGTILISATLRSHPAWRIAKTVLLPISIAGAAAFLLLGLAAGHKHAPGGLYERIFLGLELLWMAVAAWHIAVRQAAEQPA